MTSSTSASNNRTDQVLGPATNPIPTRVAVVSVLPVPDGSGNPVVGPGIRAWGLAQGLLAHGLQVGVLVQSDKPREEFWYRGLGVRTIDQHPDWLHELREFDAVVVLYASDAAYEITDALGGGSIKIALDAYLPWYVEAAASQAHDPAGSYDSHRRTARRLNATLERGDVFLVANQTQRHFYVGVLSALGVLNPFTYSRLRVLEVPFGVAVEPETSLTTSTDPYRALGIPEDRFLLLWFGAIYVWFDIDPVLAAVRELASNPRFHFVVVGGRHPLGSGDEDPPHLRARETLADLDGTQVHFVGWVPFHERFQWYAHADAAISMNVPGLEGEYSWRTRLVDLVAAKLPFITNGGDPLSEDVLAEGGAFQVDTAALRLTDVVQRLQTDPHELVRARAALATIRPRWTCAATTQALAVELAAVSTLTYDEKAFAREHHLEVRARRPRGLPMRIQQAQYLGRRTREEGLISSLRILRERLQSR